MVNNADDENPDRAVWSSQLILVRHAESTKNAEDRYSSLSGDERLTSRADADLERIANTVRRMTGELSASSVRVISAPSRRCRETAAAIRGVLGSQVEITAALRPLRTPTLAGRTTTSARERWPELLGNITQYRAGLMCGYDVGWPDEDIRALERRVHAAFGRMLTFEQPGTNVLVGHKSSLTCVLVSALRNLDRYPKTYYGYFDMPVGSITTLRSGDVTGRPVVSVGYDVPSTKDVRKSPVSELPSGLELAEGTIRFPESSCAVVQNDSGDLLLVSQQRAAGRQSLEIPGGKVNEDESPEDAALRELREECGIFAERAQLTLTLDLDLSVSVHRTHLVAVTGLEHGVAPAEFVPRWIPLPEALRMVREGQLTHAPTVVATLLAGQGRLDGR